MSSGSSAPGPWSNVRSTPEEPHVANPSQSAMCESSPHTPRRFRPQMAVAAVLALALIAAACVADDPNATPATEATTSTSADPATEATTTTAPEPEATEASPAGTAEPAGASPGTEQSNGTEAAAEFASEPSWSEIQDRLSASEQSCIRGVLDEAGLDQAGRESAMSRRLFSNDFPTAEDATMFACLAADTADEVFLTSMVAAIEPDLDAAVSDTERACLRDWLAGIDLVALVQSTGESAEDVEAGLAFLGGMAACIPDGLISLFLQETGVSFDELDEDERACARELLAGVDWNGLGGSEDDAEAAFEVLFSLSFGLLDCLPGLAEGEIALPPGEFSAEEATPAAVGEPIEGALDSADDTELYVFEAVEGEFYELRVEPGTLEDPTVALYDPDGWQLDYDDDSGGGLAPRLFWSAESSGPFYVEVGGYGAGSYTLTVAVSNVEDDHANTQATATTAGVGEPVGGSLEYDGDVDYFVFEAVEGESYDIGVSPGTLDDPTVGLYGADGWYLDYDDDSGGGLAPRLFWSTDISGPLYVEVGGYGTGSYTLTVAVSDIVDDHADTPEGATAAEVGEAVEGSLDYDGDVDYFVFDAVEGELYELNVAPGTLEDPTVALYDADGWQLDYDDDSGGSLAPRLYWPAEVSGPLFVEVGGFGAGSYTLTVARR